MNRSLRYSFPDARTGIDNSVVIRDCLLGVGEGLLARTTNA